MYPIHRRKSIRGDRPTDTPSFHIIGETMLRHPSIGVRSPHQPVGFCRIEGFHFIHHLHESFRVRRIHLLVLFDYLPGKSSFPIRAHPDKLRVTARGIQVYHHVTVVSITPVVHDILNILLQGRGYASAVIGKHIHHQCSRFAGIFRFLRAGNEDQ